jgi:hypothetical protein
MSDEARAAVMSPSDLVANSPSADDRALPFFDHLRFQEIYKEWLERGRILDDLGSVICTRSYEIRDIDTLKAMLDDACVVQDLVAGKISAATFLGQLEKVAQPTVFYGAMLEVCQFLEQRVEGFKQLISEHRSKTRRFTN